MIIVSDTTPLSELAKIGQLNLLKDVFGTLIIPQEVYQEITTGDHPAATIVPSIECCLIAKITLDLSILHRLSLINLSEGMKLPNPKNRPRQSLAIVRFTVVIVFGYFDLTT